MRRVVKLDPSEKRAMILQAWASKQSTSRDGSAIPDVGELPPVSDLGDTVEPFPELSRDKQADMLKQPSLDKPPSE